MWILSSVLMKASKIGQIPKPNIRGLSSIYLKLAKWCYAGALPPNKTFIREIGHKRIPRALRQIRFIIYVCKVCTVRRDYKTGGGHCQPGLNNESRR